MIFVRLPERTLALDFTHPTIKVDQEVDDITIKNINKYGPNAYKIEIRHTICKIHQVMSKDSFKFLQEAEVPCHPSDMFIKEIGRKKSLAKALGMRKYRSGHWDSRKAKFTREERLAIWTAYFARTTPVLSIGETEKPETIH